MLAALPVVLSVPFLTEDNQRNFGGDIMVLIYSLHHLLEQSRFSWFNIYDYNVSLL
jgi:hypothetical protein